MAQVKIYGERRHLSAVRERLSDALHAINRRILELPEEKRFHRFIALDAEDMIHPPDRGTGYTVVEYSMFEGRSPETKRALLEALMAEIPERIGIPVEALEITLFETPKANWGIRGQVADRLSLSYDVEV